MTGDEDGRGADAPFLYLPDDALAGLGLTAREIVDCIEDAIRAEAAGKLWTAPKSAVLPGDGRYIMSTLSASDTPQLTVVKTVMVSPRNPERGLAGINGAILILDSETGLLKGLIGANWVTGVRTAGLSAAVARRLANPASSSVAFIGAGVQALSHLDAFAELFPLTEIRISSRGRANMEKLAEAARAKGLSARIAETPREALEGADLVVSSITLAYDVAPFLDARWLKPGAFAAITDLGIPWEDAGMAAFGQVVIDSHVQEAASEKRMVDPALVSADLVELVGGGTALSYDPGRPSAFIFRGIAVGDFAVAALAFERAAATGAGARVSR